MKKQGYIYILFNKRNGILYTGVTSDIIKSKIALIENLNPDWNDLYESIIV